MTTSYNSLKGNLLVFVMIAALMPYAWVGHRPSDDTTDLVDIKVRVTQAAATPPLAGST